MTYTEEEAKTKWCPFVRLNDDMAGGVFNRCGPAPTLNCIGSACMAWRKRESEGFRFKAEDEFRRTGMRLVSTEGFCGLAGQP